MNKQPAPGGIEWTRIWGRPGYTANPVRGCRHGCQWRMPDGKLAICYAKAVVDRFGLKKAYPQGFESLYFDQSELGAIHRLKEPAGIFICSMSDLFGQKVPATWIMSVLATIASNQQHVFFSLTKNSRRLLEFSLPPNLFVGISAPPSFMFGKELQPQAQYVWFKKALENLHRCNAATKWVSLEPLMPGYLDLLQDASTWLDWAVIGAASDGNKTHQPCESTLYWAMRYLDGNQIPIFFKGNLSRALADKFTGWRQEFPKEI